MEKYKDKTLSIDERCEDLLSRMTVEEKVGQMLQISYTEVSKKDYERYKKLGIGSFFHALDKELDEIREEAKKTRLAIPPIFGIDAIHGHCLLNGATVFPSQLAMSCSFNRGLIYEMGKATAREVCADGLDWTFSPVLCIGRDLRWGRVNETFGEDSYVVGELGKAIIDGYECEGHIISCAKHYLAYGEATGGRDAYDSSVTERKIREVFLPPFKKASDVGCSSIMTAYGSIDTLPLTANKRILNDILKDEIGFEGFVVTDYENVRSLVNKQFVAKDIKEASKMAVEAGNDMSMNSHEFYDCMLELVRDSKIDMELIDNAVRRILKVKFRLGLFDGKARPSKDVIACEGHKKINLELARESLVLLKNENVLPLDGDTKTVAVIGPNADDIRAQFGDWTFFSHPTPKENVTPLNECYTILDGMKKVFGEENILYHKGCDIFGKENYIEKAVETAKKADVVVCVIGDSLAQYGEYRDRANLDLSGYQEELVKALVGTQKKVIAVLINGKPLCIKYLKENCDAVIEAFNGGDLGGLAVAELIAGKFNPSGKLSISFPQHGAQTPCYYNQYTGWHGGQYVDLEKGNVYDFADGLSYSKFEYSNLRLSKDKVTDNESITVSVDVKNNGTMDGKETVMLFVNDVISSVMTPTKELKGFEKVFIKSGDTKTVSLNLDIKDLALVTPELEYVVEKGEFEIMVGRNTKEYLTAILTVE
ncbi:MAG: glycoside hydrolase family 3 C-terminal domain-containing protein [Clostridia bacterium]|nr:glycoside hydrolase family 3 C-terminal domain-containing protein [Clostridia bacterium]